MPKRKKLPKNKYVQSRSSASVEQFFNVRVLAGAAIIILTVFITYLPSYAPESFHNLFPNLFPFNHSDFLLDDDKLLTDNRLIKADDGPYRFWFTTDSLDYWPVSNTSLWFEWRLWGMNPTGYHVTNLILHIVDVFLLWIVLRKLSLPGAFWAALIFAVHPVNVESVAWISQRKGLMAMLFFLLSILWYLKMEIDCLSSPKGRDLIAATFWYILSLVAFILAVLSKGSVVVLGFLLLGIIWWLRRLTVWDWVRGVPFLFFGGVGIAVNVWFQKHGVEVITREADFLQRLLGAGGVIWFYLYKACLPIDLVFIYPQWQINVGNLAWWAALAAAVIVTALLWWHRQGWSRPFLFAWGFFCVSLIPVLGFTDVGFMKYSLVSDHYQHIAIIAVIALTGAGWAVWRRQMQGSLRWLPHAVAVAVFIVLAFLTWQQSKIYNNPLILYQSTLDKNLDCSIAHNNLGTILFQAERLPEAIEHYNQALRLDTKYVDAYNNLGYAMYQVGRMPEAIDNLKQALKLKPDCPEAHNNLGLAYAKTNRVPEAIEEYKQAIKYKYDYADAYNNLGVGLDDLGHPEEAAKYFLQALHFKPDYSDAYNNLGVSLVKAGKLPEAIAYFKRAIQLKPNYIEAYGNLSLSYAQLKRPNEAIATCQKALEIAHAKGNVELINRLGSWLNAYRASLSQPQNAQPTTK